MKRWFRRRRTDQVAETRWRTVEDQVVRARQTRRQRLAGQQELVERIADLLFRHDPIGINFEHNTDEYQPEAETITVRLPEAATEHELQRIVREEFVRWFGDTAGTTESYDSIAREIWQLWRNDR